MEENDLISIIVPVYNVEKYLNKCIDSIISQTYKNLEIILVDDGSPDNCGTICDEYADRDNRIKVIHKENGGVSSARNIGIKKSNGNWIVFVDADDWIEESYCKNMLNTAMQNEADVVLCGYNRVVGNKIEKIDILKDTCKYDSHEYLIKTLNPQTGFGFVSRKIIKKDIIKEIEFDTEIEVGEDALFNIMMSKNIKKAIVLDEILYNYRINENSVVKRFDVNYEKKYKKAMLKIKEHINKNGNQQEVLQNYYNFVAFHVMLIAVNYCYNPLNKEKNKIGIMRKICNESEFKECIKKSNYENISLTRKITLFTLKYKLFFITGFICRFRQKQNTTKETNI